MALNSDIDVSLGGDFFRSRKVNVIFNEEVVWDERILQFKKIRSGFKLAFIKRRNKFFEFLYREKSVDIVKMKIMELDQVFDNFKGVYDVYIKNFVEEDSIMELCEYFESEYCVVKELKERVGFRILEFLFIYIFLVERVILFEDLVS